MGRPNDSESETGDNPLAPTLTGKGHGENLRTTMKLMLQYMACEMQVTDENKAIVILDSLEQILSIAKSSN